MVRLVVLGALLIAAQEQKPKDLYFKPRLELDAAGWVAAVKGAKGRIEDFGFKGVEVIQSTRGVDKVLKLTYPEGFNQGMVGSLIYLLCTSGSIEIRFEGSASAAEALQFPPPDDTLHAVLGAKAPAGSKWFADITGGYSSDIKVSPKLLSDTDSIPSEPKALKAKDKTISMHIGEKASEALMKKGKAIHLVSDRFILGYLTSVTESIQVPGMKERWRCDITNQQYIAPIILNPMPSGFRLAG